MVAVGAMHTVRPVWRRDPPSTLLAIGIAVNLLVAALPFTPKYNGVRLFMPVFPLLGILAGAGFGQMVGLVRTKMGAVGRWYGVALAIIFLGPAARAIAVTHPYQLSYYNMFVGGMRGAVARGLPATYWGDTYLSGWSFVSAQAPYSATVWVAPPGCASILKTYQNMGQRPDIRLSASASPPPNADFAMFQNKPNELNAGCRALLQAMERGAAPVHVTQRCGVPLLWVFDRTAIGAVQGKNTQYDTGPRQHQRR